MQTHELMAWLGPAADELTPEQIERVAEEARRISERHLGSGEAGEFNAEWNAAMSATVQYLLGETTPEDARRALDDARRREREAYVAAEQVAVMLNGDGMAEATAARAVGIDRMSVRKALGKR